jgi:ATP-binding cassette subfamily F protein 3
LQGVNKEFDGKKVFKEVSFDLQRGDKLAVVGVNGAGKTTLLKIMAGIEPAQGKIRQGHNVILTYFGQHQAQELSGELTVLDTVYHAAEDMTITQVRSLLGAFLFSGDEVEKKVQVLSGGEKSRVALAKMLIKPANLMLLDEPTNHLDITSQEVLQEAMRQYEGTIVIVSHNRFFVNSFVNKVLEIRDGKATMYLGNIDDYLAVREEQNSAVEAGKKLPSEKKKNDGSDNRDRKAQRRERAEQRQKISGKLKPLKKKAAATEKDIETLEERKEQLETMMADPELYADQKRWAEISKEYNTLKHHLERQYEQWEQAQEAIEQLEQSFT